MGFVGEVWRLVRLREPGPGEPGSEPGSAQGSEPVGEIVIDDTDFPWLHGRFVPGPAYPAVEPLFVRSAALSEAEDWEAFDEVYRRIRAAVSLGSPAGPVPEFLLHIEGDRAWFRWSDEPFGDDPE
ncbi:hypothetical protein [Kitasatospora sp. NPDC088346]|uniref:hypothetical protein n=1 Tax=Kitasatospora sp. NPDC088346 TaxID=3364073 RepID=UPI0038134E14